MRCLLQHGGEAEEVARRRLVDNHFLLVFVDRGDARRARNQDVGALRGAPIL